MPTQISLADVAKTKLREAQRLLELEKSFDAESVADDAKELFARLNDSVGVAGALRVIIEAHLLEERLEDATKLVEEELAKAKQAKSEACQIIMLKASISVKIAQGRPRDAINVADEAEKILLGLATQDERGAGELLLLVAKANLSQGSSASQQASLNAALQAIGWYSKAEDAKGEADSWRAVLEARAALRKYEDGLRAAEAAMVIYNYCSNEAGQGLCLLSIAKAHLKFGQPLKAKKASEKALQLFQQHTSDMLASASMDVWVQAMIRLEQRKEGLQRAKQELSALLGSGDKWALPRMRGCVVKALVGMDKKKEAFAEAEKILDAARSLNSNRYKVEALQQMAALSMVLGQVDKAKQLAEELLPVCKELADLEAEAAAHEVIGKAVEHRGAFEQKAAKEREAEDLIIKLKQALQNRNGADFKDVLEQCYEHENVYTEDVEELIGPVIATDPEGLYKFFLSNQPEKWKIDPEDDRKFHTAQQFDRRLMYYAFRWGAMGYGPGFRLIKTAVRLQKDPGEGAHAMGTLDLMDNAPEWEEQVKWHAGMLDCVLQVSAARWFPTEMQDAPKIETVRAAQGQGTA